MAAYAFDATWNVRPLAERDRPRILAMLAKAPLLNVFVISKIEEDGLGALTPFVEVTRDGQPVVVASIGSNVVLASDVAAPAEIIDTAIRFLAERIITNGSGVRAIIADADLVERLWVRLCSRVDPPTVVRLNQPVYALTGSGENLPDLERARYGRNDDLDLLVPACAAMHVEEVGIDPLSRDAAAYRHRVRELIARRRSIVLMERGRIAFKCEFSAVTGAAVQLMGVWTAPEFRRRGYARAGMREVCGHLLRQGKTVTLFVNDFNHPARALYEGLGFREIGTNRALIW